MSEQKTHENFFKFSVYQESSIISERIFSADVYSQMSRYSVNIRELIPSIIQRLQKLLSKRNPEYKVTYGDKEYDLLKYYDELTSFYRVRYNKLTKPQSVTQVINGKTIKGVECKFCLFINNNLIVERVFYVDNYNPSVRFSSDISATVSEIVDDIKQKIKLNDDNNIWDDFDIINCYGFPHVNNVRELGREQREFYLKNMGDKEFVKNVRNQIKKKYFVEKQEEEVSVED
jgi:hypothetical protein